MDDRLTELETRVSYQDQIIDDLNKVIIELRNQVEKLDERYLKIAETLKEDSVKDSSLEVPPPHY